MILELLDPAVLLRDLPEHGLARGDLGAVVELYDGRAYEVEFVTAGGGTRALVTIEAADLRRLGPEDVLAVRFAMPAA